MMSMLRTAAHSVANGASARLRGSACSGFLAPRIPMVFGPVAPSRPYRYTPPVQMGRRSAKIALRKGKADAKKAKVYGKIGKKIIQIVKAGGADPATNSKLSDLLKQARELGVPRDILDRNIKRASDAKQGDFSETVYEAYGPGGTGFIVECLTDNVNRSASDVKAAMTKGGAKPAEPGSVLFSFKRQGLVVVDNTDEESLFEGAMEAGADDIRPIMDEEGNPTTSYKVFTAVEDFGSSIAKLRELGFAVNGEASELVYLPGAEVEVDDEAFAKCEALFDRLMELDDVDAVYTNAGAF
ncbi:MAG: transcriptional regulator TACO1-like protein [Monoraphidium minutum]|nr:MAG: transcriptional regulator TACO1-like protein [Monoraphidium minutum]